MMNILTSVVNAYHIRDSVMPKENIQKEETFKKTFEREQEIVKKVTQAQTNPNVTKEEVKNAFNKMKNNAAVIAFKMKQDEAS